MKSLKIKKCVKKSLEKSTINLEKIAKQSNKKCAQKAPLQ